MPSSSSSHLAWDGVDSDALLNLAMEAYYADITNAVRRRGHPSSTARDVVHDLYVKLSARPEVLQNKRSIKAFLCRAAINLGIDLQRRETKEARLFSGSEREALLVPNSGHAPDHRLDIEARLSILRTAIAELPERRRAVFILHRLHHLTPDQISAKLNISRNMVDRHLRRAFAHCLDRIL
ncbi:RNA polymerase sigma factor [Rhizobium sp. AQ_MP]|uniref:RNA polymerase sigma factor n=1 Tax=Rhizobium sp. AQ_MP TaxID=2761536 RepID=UPI00163980D5|nr:RNA polymerase sigma factor [Rhizobium sp. AQ_MP]MBC2775655.1 RNA polymerase sigma factor [Rhizobium sp. AQ_MP]